MRYYDTFETPYGQMLLAATEHGVSGVYFDRQKYFPETAKEWKRDARHAPLEQAKREPLRARSFINAAS